MDDLFLHPHCRHFELDGLIDHFLHKFRTSEDIDDVDLLGHLEQGSVSFLTQAFVNVRIHRDDAVSVALHVGGHAVAGAQRITGESDHCDRFRTL